MNHPQQCEQASLPEGLHDQTLALLAHERFVSFELELARNSKRLVAAVAKQADMAFTVVHGRFTGAA